MTEAKREDHVEWCKSRAREYLKEGDLTSAVASMLSDMQKHPETDTPALTAVGLVGIMEAANGNQQGVERFIDGFN
jgi:hypothetical protein